MAFLDFIKRRNQPAPAEQKPETQAPRTARELYALRDAQEKATANPISPGVKAQADRALERVDKGSFYLRAEASQAQAPTGGSHSEPMRQNQLSQEHVAFLLSPTTAQVGKVAESPSEGRSKESPEKQASPTQAPSKSRDGWER
jgi:hypothetical protein